MGCTLRPERLTNDTPATPVPYLFGPSRRKFIRGVTRTQGTQLLVAALCAATMAAARELVRNMKAGETLNGMTLTHELKEMYKGREQLLVT